MPISKIPYFQFKIEKNNVNNYLRVKKTSNHINMDIDGFYAPKNIRKSLLLGDLKKKIQDGGGGNLENGRLLNYAHPFTRVMEATFFI